MSNHFCEEKYIGWGNREPQGRMEVLLYKEKSEKVTLRVKFGDLYKTKDWATWEKGHSWHQGRSFIRVMCLDVWRFSREASVTIPGWVKKRATGKWSEEQPEPVLKGYADHSMGFGLQSTFDRRFLEVLTKRVTWSDSGF